MAAEQIYSRIEQTLMSRFLEAESINHNGDKGENREEFLKDFLSTHLPSKFGVTKGEVINTRGDRSHAIDIIIYDKVKCPLLYSGKTSILPMEGVYGIIEVKSRLDKSELLDAAKSISLFKQMHVDDPLPYAYGHDVGITRPSRPFGFVFGYRHHNNSLLSITKNIHEYHSNIKDSTQFINLTSILGSGLVKYSHVDFLRGKMKPLLDTNEMAKLTDKRNFRVSKGQPCYDLLALPTPEDIGDKTFGRFFTYLLMALNQMIRPAPDLGRYLQGFEDIQVETT